MQEQLTVCPNADTLAAGEGPTAACPSLSHTELTQVLIHELGDIEKCPNCTFTDPEYLLLNSK